jgi:PIN domain nuclease of toxin-antitoxin system
MTALDASAVLAFLFQERGGEIVAGVIAGSCLSTVNLSEVLGRFAKDGHDAHVVGLRLAAAGLEMVPFLAEDAALAASLRPQTDPLGLSLGGRACLALALARGVPVLTADRQWGALDLGIEIRLIR